MHRNNPINQLTAEDFMGNSNYKYENFMGSKEKLPVQYDNTTGLRYAIDKNGKFFAQDENGNPLTGEEFKRMKARILKENKKN